MKAKKRSCENCIFRDVLTCLAHSRKFKLKSDRAIFIIDEEIPSKYNRDYEEWRVVYYPIKKSELKKTYCAKHELSKN